MGRALLGIELAIQSAGLIQVLLDEQQLPAALECATDSSKSTALLSLLLSCFKRLQQYIAYVTTGDKAANPSWLSWGLIAVDVSSKLPAGAQRGPVLVQQRLAS